MVKCPICRSKVTLGASAASCESGHHFPLEGGVYKVLHPGFKEKVVPFLQAFSDYRKPYTDKVDVQKLRDLPFEYSFDKNTWVARQQDIKVFHRDILIGQESSSILEIGSWNCWFTNHLSKDHEVVAVDLFIDEKDGLGANKYYDHQWTSIQLDLNKLELIDGSFDIIILNRCLPYFESLEETLQILKSLLNNGGTLYITGVNKVRNPSDIVSNLRKAEVDFESRYKVTFNMTSFAGYLSKKDFKTLEKEEIQLRLYSPYNPMSYKGYLFPKKSISYFGKFKKQ